MLNINDDEMMGSTEKPSPDKIQETVKILNAMIEAKGKKTETPQSIKDALADTRAKKSQRYAR